MSSIQDYVVQGGQSVTAGTIDAFRRQISDHRLRAEALIDEGQPALRDQASFLLRYIEDVLDGVWSPTDLAAVPEAIFAVRYLSKGVDIIPDSVAGGYTDDAAILKTVLHGHFEEFQTFAGKNRLEVPSAA